MNCGNTVNLSTFEFECYKEDHSKIYCKGIPCGRQKTNMPCPVDGESQTVESLERNN